MRLLPAPPGGKQLGPGPLASMAFSMMRHPDLRARIREAPYPRLHRQLHVLGEAEDVIRRAEGQWNFQGETPTRRPQAGRTAQCPCV